MEWYQKEIERLNRSNDSKNVVIGEAQALLFAKAHHPDMDIKEQVKEWMGKVDELFEVKP